ncbi:MAG: TonB family protein [Bernardetiaceae bacterium]|jgi:protein TonB|nr:TonB family protein [Bernardetiaceae bacterium]
MDYKKPHWSDGYGLRFNIGLVASLALVLTAFEWKTVENHLVDLPALVVNEDTTIQIPVTVIAPPPPPKAMVVPTNLEVISEDEIETELDGVTFGGDINDNTPIVAKKVEVVDAAPAPEPEDENDLLLIVEENAAPTGGYDKLYKFFRDNIKYPTQAQRTAVEGKVFVSFVVERDGSISNVVVMKGIGAGCDEEALRVVGKMPHWQPGKQRAKPVRQKMVIPINFTLSK